MLTFHLLKKIASLARNNDEDEPINFIGSAAVVGGMMGAARMLYLLFTSLLPLFSAVLSRPSLAYPRAYPHTYSRPLISSRCHDPKFTI